MKRRLLHLAVFLLLGAIVNVAVAWGCAAFPTPLINSNAYLGRFFAPSDADELRDGVFLRSIGWTPSPDKKPYVFSLQRGTRTVFGLDQWVWYERAERDDGGPVSPVAFLHGAAERRAAGWPTRALAGELWNQLPFVWQGLTTNRWIAHDVLTLVSDETILGPQHVLLPLRPLWPGFALNTLFYAAILFALIRGPVILRRAIRRRRGLCIACGYDLRGRGRGHGHHQAAAAMVCPECGMHCPLSHFRGRGRGPG